MIPTREALFVAGLFMTILFITCIVSSSGYEIGGIIEKLKALQIIINCCKLKLNEGMLHEKIICFTVMFLYARFFYSMHKELNNFKNWKTGCNANGVG